MEYKILEPQHSREIQEKYHINSLLAKVIDTKFTNEDEFSTFMNPKLIYHDFSLFEEADMTLDRIYEAIENEEKICIYGDYDCDGILATTILVQAFLELGIEVGYHIPHRFEDGYGLNKKRVEQIASKGYSLIITVDNGVGAFEAVERANELGVDVIVTDHHQFSTELPEAVSFIHTKLSPEYPFKEICGGFIAYKLASALLHKQDKYLFCLAATTTISDMMPLTDENRSLVKRALTFLNEEHYEAFDMLLGDKKVYDSTALGYTIAPKINAFGRLPEYCHPNILVKYFLKEAPHDFRMKVAQKAIDLNTKRQSLTREFYQEALSQGEDSFLYWSSEDVHEGIVGLIAGQYTRDKQKPSFVMHYDKESGIYKGSARSVQGFSLHGFFEAHKDLFVTCGGHALAGGFSVDKDHYEELYHCLKEEIEQAHFVLEETVIRIDRDDLTLSNVESLSLLEPYGMCNREPIFYLEHCPIDQYQLLSEGKHLKLNFHIGDQMISALYFQHGDDYDQLQNKKAVTLIGKLNINTFRNRKSINFILEDVI